MRADGVVVPAPGLDQDLGLGQRVEDLAVQKLVTQRAVERFTVAVLPWAARRDVERLHPDPAQPVLHRLCNELRAIV